MGLPRHAEISGAARAFAAVRSHNAAVRAPGLWGIVGVTALLANAIYRLMPRTLELFDYELDALQLATLIVWVAFMGYSEGYRAFHQMFSPRVVARARALDASPRPLFAIAAPLFCMGLFHATRRRKIVAWSITLGVIGLVLLVRQLPQPWRGIIDAGVVVGLGFGVVSLVYYSVRAGRGMAMTISPDLPDPGE